MSSLISRIRQELCFDPTSDQKRALEVFDQFVYDYSSQAVMILRGSAGTGKTTLAGAIVRTLQRLGQKLMLMAPTGRAAKVFSLNSGTDAYTIHRRIYREKSYQGLDGQFNLNDNRYRNTLFIVDEASMVSRGGVGESMFGSGSLLDDLIRYVYSGDGCRLMLIGDAAQLPPVGEAEAPALNGDVMAGYGLSVHECDLDEVLRQSEDSGILYNATAIRRMITYDTVTDLPRIELRLFADIESITGGELIECLGSSYAKVGLDETIVVTRSNKRANIYNQGIRGRVLDREDELCGGDMLMIVRNNYYWTDREQEERQKEQRQDIDSKMPTFLANGDRAKVWRVRNFREFYGFRFADVWLQFPDYDNYEMQVTVIMDSLLTDAPALTREQSEKLFQEIMADYEDIPRKSDRLQMLRNDIYFNALQIKFAYAVTCHKAQGGQWSHVYIDQGYMTDDMVTPDYIHWLYTAFTRATDKLYLVNWPKNQVKE